MKEKLSVHAHISLGLTAIKAVLNVTIPLEVASCGLNKLRVFYNKCDRKWNITKTFAMYQKRFTLVFSINFTKAFVLTT